jgi:hypothetical protein
MTVQKFNKMSAAKRLQYLENTKMEDMPTWMLYESDSRKYTFKYEEPERGVSPEAQKQLEDLIHGGYENNKFYKEGVQRRTTKRRKAVKKVTDPLKTAVKTAGLAYLALEAAGVGYTLYGGYKHGMNMETKQPNWPQPKPPTEHDMYRQAHIDKSRAAQVAAAAKVKSGVKAAVGRMIKPKMGSRIF